MYYFDIGSSTIKLYEYKKELSLIEEKSIMFKRGFSEDGIQEENIEKMMAFIKEVKEKYNLNKNNTYPNSFYFIKSKFPFIIVGSKPWISSYKSPCGISLNK